MCYSLTWLTGILIFLLEIKNKSVRFHALQSVITFLALSLILGLLQALVTPPSQGFIEYFLINLNPVLIPYLFLYDPANTLNELFGSMLILSFAPLFLWIFMMLKAYRGDKYRLPLVGALAEKVIEKTYSPD